MAKQIKKNFFVLGEANFTELGCHSFDHVEVSMSRTE